MKMTSSEENAVIDLVLLYVNDVKDKNEHYIIDPKDRRLGNWNQIWYSHIYQGGSYNHAFGFIVHRNEVEIAPAAQYGEAGAKGSFVWPKPGKFNLIDPDGLEMKKFIRYCFDEVKKHQKRTEHTWFWPTEI
jgi:hypothetical protein